jgi:DNA polymerase III epsilon subunit-like protein
MSDKAIGKKLRKRVKSGSINTLKLYEACLSSHLRGLCSLEVKVDNSRLSSKPRFDFHSSELKDWLKAYLYDKEVIPRPFNMGNRYFCRNIVVLHYTDFDVDIFANSYGNGGKDGNHTSTNTNEALPQALLSSQSVFDEISADACTSESKIDVHASFKTMWNSIPTSLGAEASIRSTSEEYVKHSPAYLMKISKQASEVVPLPLNMFVVSGQEVEALTTTNAENNGTKDEHNGKKQDGNVGMSHDAAPVSAVVTDTAEYAKYVIATSLLKMWGYPLPTTDSADIINNNNDSSNNDSPVEDAGKALDHNKRSREKEIDGSLKKRKVEKSATATDLTSNSCIQGEYSQSIPSLQEVQSILKNGHEWFNTTVTVENKTQLSHYQSTMSRTSPQYRSLFMNGEIETHKDVAQVPVDVCAIDCEMCLTAKGSALTRLSIITVDGSTILDSYIQPDEPIIDYVTQYSGITEELLQTQPTLSQRQAQLAFLRIVSAETILCGHSLDNDLKALQLCHMRCIDSCIIYPHSRGFPFRMKLKDLTKNILNVNIQPTVNEMKNNNDTNRLKTSDNQDEENAEKGEGEVERQNFTVSNEPTIGHSSVVDAQMAMGLVQAKIKGGILFGLPRKSFLNNQMKNIYGGKGAMSLFHPLSLGSASKVGESEDSLSNHGFFWDADVWCDEHYTQSYSQVFGGGHSHVYISKREKEKEQSREDALMDRSKDIVNNALHFLTPSTVSSTDVPPVRLVYIGLRHHSVAQTKLTIERIQSTLKALASGQGNDNDGNGKGGGVLVVCAQKSLQALTKMRKMKFMVNTQNTTLPWDEKKEQILKAACSEANIASVAWSCHG